jgi:hypothetical protein
MTDEQLLGFFARKTLRAMDLAMRKNHGIDPFAATYTAPIERPDFEDSFLNHESAASMAAVDSCLLLGGRGFQDLDHCDSPPLGSSLGLLV